MKFFRKLSLRKHVFFPSRYTVLFFLLLVAISFTVYALTALPFPYPGLSELDTAVAADIVPIHNLAHPLYHLTARILGHVPFLDLPLRLNLFSAACGALSVGLFYLLVMSLFARLALETPGGAMHVHLHDDDDDDDDDDTSSSSSNSPEKEGIPLSVIVHNQFTTRSAMLGGIGAALTLAFCVPFWISATRFYPITFDTMFFFLIVNLLLDYDQKGHDCSLYFGIFLTSIFWIESPLFLLIAPFVLLILFRTLFLSGVPLTTRTVTAIVTASVGAAAAWFLLWQVALRCGDMFPNLGVKVLLRTFLDTILHQTIQLLPHFSNWHYTVISLILSVPIAILLVFNAFFKRNLFYFLLELILSGIVVINLLDLDFSIWNQERNILDLPVYGYIFIAFCAGLIVTVWDIMRENKKLSTLDEQPPPREEDEDDDDDMQDLYEMHDNNAVCAIGSWLCWLLLALIIAAPFFSFKDVNPKNALFMNQLMTVLDKRIHPGDWILNASETRYTILLGKHLKGENVHSITVSSDPNKDDSSQALNKIIRSDPMFAESRFSLINAAEISKSSFLREWFKDDTNAFRRIVLFRDVNILRQNHLLAIPSGFFFRCVPENTPLDSLALLKEHEIFAKEMEPLVLPAKKDRIPFFSGYRKALGRQIAIIGNELGCLLAQQEHPQEAVTLFKDMEKFDAANTAILFNRYDLVARQKVSTNSLDELEDRIRDIPQHVDTFNINNFEAFSSAGTLITPEIVPILRNRFWIQRGKFYKFMSAQERDENARLVDSMQNKKREIRNIITQELDANEYDKAQRALNLLHDLDEKDPFVAANRARIAIQKGNCDEAERWIAIAKGNKAPKDSLLWHDASVLFLKGKIDDAKNMLNKVLPDHTDDVYLWGLMAKILIKQGNFTELEKRVFPGIRNASSKKDHYLFYEVQGYIFANAKNLTAARNSFKTALKLNNYLSATREEILRIDDLLDIPSFSEEDAKDCLRILPNHVMANFLFGMVRYHYGEWDLAQNLFLRSIKQKCTPAALAGQGAVLLEQQKYADAETCLRTAYKEDPSRTFTAYSLARLLIETHRLDEAQKVLTLLVEKDPDDVMSHFTQLQLFAAQGRMEKAYNLMQQILPEAEHLPAHEQRTINSYCAALMKKLQE